MHSRTTKQLKNPRLILNESEFSTNYKKELDTDLQSLMKEYDPYNLNNSLTKSFIIPKKTVCSLERTLEKTNITLTKNESP